MSNIYHESEELVSKLRAGQIPSRSIVVVQWPSGAKQSIRFHYWNKERDKLVGCDMGWDNLALEEYDIKQGVIINITKE